MTNEELKCFGEKMKELRKRGRLTQKNLAMKLHISRSCLANYESMHRHPDNEIVNSIADFFGVSVDYLLGRESTADAEDFLAAKEGFHDVKHHEIRVLISFRASP